MKVLLSKKQPNVEDGRKDASTGVERMERIETTKHNWNEHEVVW